MTGVATPPIAISKQARPGKTHKQVNAAGTSALRRLGCRRLRSSSLVSLWRQREAALDCRYDTRPLE